MDASVYVPSETWTIQKIITFSVGFLEKAGIDRPRVDVEVLLGWVLGLDRIDLYCRFDQPVKESERSLFKKYLVKRAEGYPLAYITKSQPFYKSNFTVAEDLLVPRQDTEVLVEKVLEEIGEESRILDIGTGTGCILLSLLREKQHCTGVAWDISESSCRVSGENAKRMQVEDRFQFQKKDALEESSYIVPSFEEVYDIIVSNPPYISRESAHIEDAVKEYEPECALFADHDGLAFYQVMALHSPKLLKPGGLIAVEIGFDQGQSVTDVFLQCGFSKVNLYNDLSGHPRVVTARWI